MESKHMLAAIFLIWVATALISILAPSMSLTSGDTLPITSWTVPICAVIATFFVVRERKQ